MDGKGGIVVSTVAPPDHRTGGVPASAPRPAPLARERRAPSYFVREKRDASIFMPNSTYPYRSHSFVCSLSTSVNYAGVFLSAFVLEFFLTVQSFFIIFDYPGVPNYTFYIPTFQVASADLEKSLCQLFTAITALLPASFACTSIESDVGCGTGATCAQGFLCAVVGVVFQGVNVAVDILITIRSIVGGSNAPSNPLVANNACQVTDPTQALNCLISMIAYMALQTIFAYTQVRSLLS